MESGEEDLLAFLRNRNVEEEIILKLHNDKIDSSVIRLMSDAELAKYIPRFGDRVAVVAFCRKSQPGISRSELLGKIKSKISSSSIDKRIHAPQRHMGNENAKRKKRRIELGWMNFSEEDNQYKQVRTPKGGGTRHLSVDRHAKVREIKEMAQSLFFPNGKCRLLKLEDYYCNICDFLENEIDLESTVEELYDKNKVKMLRIYLYTKHRSIQTKTEEGSEAEFIQIDLSEETEIVFINQTVDQSNELAMEQHENVGGERSDAEITAVSAYQNEVSHDVSTESDVILGASVSNSVSLNDTLPWDGSNTKLVLVINRGNCLSELIQAFADHGIIHKDVSIKRKLPNGQIEDGEGSGVFRDCLSEFWGEFYNKCTLGREVKVPYLRHEYQAKEWQAVARIILVGWKSVRYFPLLLSLPFLEEVLYDTPYTCLTESFLQYVTKEEQEILSNALKSFHSVSKEELIDVLDAHDCHYCPTENTIKEIVYQLAHKTLIQTPMYVIECWKPILNTLSDTLYPQWLVEITQERIPTPRRVRELLKFPENMSSTQSTVARHLKKYIGECDNNMLKCSLRFCTGADILFGQPITVQFIETSQFQCRPQAHTCGSHLMLPINYQNYPDLRSDFNSVLMSSVWVMDII